MNLAGAGIGGLLSKENISGASDGVIKELAGICAVSGEAAGGVFTGVSIAGGGVTADGIGVVQVDNGVAAGEMSVVAGEYAGGADGLLLGRSGTGNDVGVFPGVTAGEMTVIGGVVGGENPGETDPSRDAGNGDDA